ncbi:TIM barrel protein [bacterium]|nr:TIM barrel protein [bacterium]
MSKLLSQALSAVTGESTPTIAVSAKWYSFPDRFEWLASQGFSFEYTSDPEQLSLIGDHTRPFLDKGIAIRHHGFFPGFEIGDKDSKQADTAMDLHFKTLDAIRGIGEPFITLHVGLTRRVEIVPNRVCDNLGRLVDYAKNLGITVSLENLKQGVTSNPKTVREWADCTGAMITLDIGHAVSSELVSSGEETVLGIIDLFEDRLAEVHLYEREIDRHYAPENMVILGPIIDRLLKARCPWWTIELDDYEDILKTRQLIETHLLSKLPGRLFN